MERFVSRSAAADAAAARAALASLLGSAPEIEGLPADLPESVERYVRLLLDASRRLNLTRIVEPEAVARLHLLDSLVAAPQIDALGASMIADLGSGGGLPAIPLALARPRLTWLLVESTEKKAAVLRSFATELGLERVEVVAARAEQVGHEAERRAAFDLVTARALAPLPVLVELALPLVRVGGALLAWKGPAIADDGELRRGAEASEILGGAAPEVLPTTHAALGGHQLVLVHKRLPTPDRFPRRPGVPGRRPLA